MLTIETKSAKETKKAAKILADEVKNVERRRALVIALEGNLGAGKTTFAQGFAEELGIKENVLSPTFVLMKVYEIETSNKRQAIRKNLTHFVHIDCYRIDSAKDIAHLGFKELCKDKNAIILIEWADRIKKLIPKDALWIRFEHGKKENQRVIRIMK